MRKTAIDRLVGSLNRNTYSKDAVEALMRMAFEEGVEEGRKKGKSSQIEEEKERTYGPMFT